MDFFCGESDDVIVGNVLGRHFGINITGKDPIPIGIDRGFDFDIGENILDDHVVVDLPERFLALYVVSCHQLSDKTTELHIAKVACHHGQAKCQYKY